VRALALSHGQRRYYTCPGKFNSRHNHAVPVTDAARCPLPSLNAELIEDAAWRMVADELLDPDRRRATLAAARARRAEATTRVAARLQIFDTLLGREQRRLDRCIAQLDALDPEVSDEDREDVAALERDREQVENTLADLRRERATAEASQAVPGLSNAEATELEAYAAEIRAGICAATPATHRRVFQLLRLRGTVRAGDELTASLKPFRMVSIEWTGVLWPSVRSRSPRMKLDTAFAPLSRA
jgi:hypothetical protein